MGCRAAFESDFTKLKRQCGLACEHTKQAVQYYLYMLKLGEMITLMPHAAGVPDDTENQKLVMMWLRLMTMMTMTVMTTVALIFAGTGTAATTPIIGDTVGAQNPY